MKIPGFSQMFSELRAHREHSTAIDFSWNKIKTQVEGLLQKKKKQTKETRKTSPNKSSQNHCLCSRFYIFSKHAHFKCFRFTLIYNIFVTGSLQFSGQLNDLPVNNFPEIPPNICLGRVQEHQFK